MKWIYILLMTAMLLPLTGCQERITLENVQMAETEYQYAKATLFGSLKEFDSNHLIVTEAKDFTNMLLSVQLNRSYKKANRTDEGMLFSEHYKEKNQEQSEIDFAFLNEFYQKYQLTTELVGIHYHKVIIIGDDAFLDIETKNILTSCISNDIAKQLGYPAGLNDTASSRFHVKLIYVDREYFLYDYERVPLEGTQLAFQKYADSVQVPEQVELPEVSGQTPPEEAPPTGTNTPAIASVGATEKKEIEGFLNRLARLQNDRNYETLQGNEDYALLSDEYIAKINQQRDDIAYTKEVYRVYEIVTEFQGLILHKIEKQGESYLANVSIRSRMLHCVSDEIAIKCGYSGGIGSSCETKFDYTVKKINGVWKLTDSIQL